MKPIYLENILFKNGTSISINEDDIVVIVGPNNSGKSKLLDEITSQLQSHNPRDLIVDKLTIKKNVDFESIFNTLKSKGRIIIPEQRSGTFQKTYSITSSKESFKQAWDGQGIGMFAKLLVNQLKTIQRLTTVKAPKIVKMTVSEFIHPIHFMQRDDSLELYFSELFKQAFGEDLILHRAAGNTLPLYVGQRPGFEDNEDRVSFSYVKKIEDLPLLENQGDGMKSFVGILLHTLITEFSIVLIDEPESFLHPPQARLLGKMIGSDLPDDRQLILATHSGDFLRGLLDTAQNKLRILRIERDGSVNTISELNPSEVDLIWNDSLLRHSNVLDGIFHSKVILCESDSDCTFYSVLFDQLLLELGESYRDYMFIHCGGKHRIPKVLKALMQLRVPIEVICDFDILNSDEPLKSIIAAYNGDWDLIKDDLKKIQDAINSKKPELESKDVKEQIQAILDGVISATFPTDKSKEIREIIRRSSAWKYAKQVGSSFIPSGDATHSYNQLSTYLSSLGIHVVHVGELEGFCRSVGNHGPKWVEEVLKKDLEKDPELKEPKEFLKRIM
jgi:energy-coupling factor transporter ATP-binding protein EcfA2